MPSSTPVEFLRLIRLLLEHDSDFVIIGGLALQIQGGDYITDDADFAINRRRGMLAPSPLPWHRIIQKPVDWPTKLPIRLG